VAIENEFEEYHYKMLAVANTLATKNLKQLLFTNIAVLKNRILIGIDIDDSYKLSIYYLRNLKRYIL
jgi:hypothetical protein